MSGLELLHRVPLFAWLPEEGAEALSDCFDLCVEEPAAGESLPTGDRIGCLLRGEASFRWDGGERTLSVGELFALGEDGRTLTPGVLTAGRDCVVAWFQSGLVRHVCYGACWYHVRLLEEIGKIGRSPITS